LVPTLRKSHSNAASVLMLATGREIWRFILGFTPGKIAVQMPLRLYCKVQFDGTLEAASQDCDAKIWIYS
jgi:hypothetical protein